MHIELAADVLWEMALAQGHILFCDLRKNVLGHLGKRFFCLLVASITYISKSVRTL